MKIVNRIKKSDDFAATIHKGYSTRLPSFIVHVRPTNMGYTRIGISVSSKLGNAVIRNRTKRQVRAICDSVIEYNKQSLDIVIVVRKEFLNNTFNDNKSQICDFMNTTERSK